MAGNASEYAILNLHSRSANFDVHAAVQGAWTQGTCMRDLYGFVVLNHELLRHQQGAFFATARPAVMERKCKPELSSLQRDGTEENGFLTKLRSFLGAAERHPEAISGEGILRCSSTRRQSLETGEGWGFTNFCV